MILAIIFVIIALALLCKLTFHLIIYALPIYVGATAAIWLHSAGTGWLGSSAASIAAAIATLVIAHWLLALGSGQIAAHAGRNWTNLRGSCRFYRLSSGTWGYCFIHAIDQFGR